LGEIAGWRKKLAQNIALRNPDLDTRELNVAVQSTIDRIVFLRICEARGIERYGQLQPCWRASASICVYASCSAGLISATTPGSSTLSRKPMVGE